MHDGLDLQPIPIDSEVAAVVHHEIARSKARQIVEKMGALAQLDIHLRQCRFDDCPGSGNLAPVHRNAERRMGSAPTPESDQQKWSVVARVHG